MKKILTILTSLIILFYFQATSYGQNYKQVKIYLNNRTYIQKLNDAGLEIDHAFFTKDNAAVVFLSDEEFAKLQSTGFRYDVLINDWYLFYNNLPQMTPEEKLRQKNESSMKYGVNDFGYGSMGGFYTLAEVSNELDSMRLHYPNLISVKQSIGNTTEGRPIYMVKISDNPDVDENEPQILFTAIHHAREPMGMAQLMYYMYYLLENYNTDPAVKYLVDNREIYCIPVVNPDGYEYNHQQAPNGGYMWRKNKSDNNGNGIFEEYYDGVDLNRNYGPYAYWNSSNGGSGTYPGDETYRGTAPFSEPETQAIRDFLMTKHFKNCLNYHAFGEDLIYPYGALNYETPDSLVYREYARDMTSYNGYIYGRDVQTVGYATRGNSDDYMYDGDIASNGGNIIAMTPEVGNGSDYFWPPQNRIFPIAEQNLLPNLYYTWVAGAKVSFDHADYNVQYFNPGDNIEMTPTLKNKGLSTGYNLTVQLSSSDPLITVTNGTAQIDSIQKRGLKTLPASLTFSISSSTPVDYNFNLVLTTLAGTAVMSQDTIAFITGVPAYIFADTTNDPTNLWTITATPSNPHWGITTSSYHSAPNSYTDSPSGNYVDNATVTMTLTNAIDLSAYSNPKISFWTKYQIEDNWDYGQVLVSSNNGSSWTPMQGIYTNPGTGDFQPNGQPLYDGYQLSWVQETMPITTNITSQMKIRFQLKSDTNVNYDGWYVDDIGVIVYTTVPVELTSFTAEAGKDNVALHWSTATELNNKEFEIQRTSDLEAGAKKWITLGFIDGQGTSTISRKYKFIDNNPAEGKSLYRLKQIDFAGTFRIYGPVEINFKVPVEYSLSQNYPNPFNPSTEINYSIAKPGFVTLKVYNILGSEVAALVNEYQAAGIHKINFSIEGLGKNISSGIYFYTIKADNFVQTRKMIVLK